MLGTLLIIVAVLIAIYALARAMAHKMYDLKLTPHAETPDKFAIPFQEVRFPTRNQKQLYGWWMPVDGSPEQYPTLILIHGWSRNLGRMLRYIQNLHPLKYNLLAFDARHHGSSDPDHHASMYKFGQDIAAAVKFACEQGIDPSRVGVLGLSIGGAGSVYAAALEPCIRAVVTVGAPAHPVDVMLREFRQHKLPDFLSKIVLKSIENTIGAKYQDFAPVENIAKAQADFLIIHGDQDETVVPGQAERWMIQGRGHSNCHYEPDFWQRVHTFLQTKLA